MIFSFAAIALSLQMVVATDTRTKEFPPGWNGKAQKPPMGWRSWNAFHAAIDQELIEQHVNALRSSNRTIGNRIGSLYEVGYRTVGVDEGWEACGAGINGTQHDAKGNPTIDTKKFPDMNALVEFCHGNDVEIGWYQNGCACGERKAELINYEGDIRNLHDFGFDAVKIDGCGAQRNMTLYAELMKQSGKNYSIENCHWGRCDDIDDSSCPTQTWCPFNWYRSSGDINSNSDSWMNNLQTTIKFQDVNAPLSKPGCWAYPDMLEVGRVTEPMKGTFYTWNRAHFGAWCIVSSPLILGLDLRDQDKLNPILDIITNEEAIAINQQWSGHPGRLVNSTGSSVLNMVQTWAKPQPNNAQAALIINSSPKPLHYHGINLQQDLGMVGTEFTARDIWNKKDFDNSVFQKDPETTNFMFQLPNPIAPYDSAFVLIQPKN